jgi:hypothetical protein
VAKDERQQIGPSGNMMSIINRSVVVVGSPLSIVTPHWQETLFLVADQPTTYSFPNCLLLMTCDEVHIKAE